MRTHIFTGSFRPIIHITYVHHFFCLLERRGVLKASIQGACRGVVFGGGITSDLTASGVTPDLTAQPKILTRYEAPKNYRK